MKKGQYKITLLSSQNRTEFLVKERKASLEGFKKAKGAWKDVDVDVDVDDIYLI